MTTKLEGVGRGGIPLVKNFFEASLSFWSENDGKGSVARGCRKNDRLSKYKPLYISYRHLCRGRREQVRDGRIHEGKQEVQHQLLAQLN